MRAVLVIGSNTGKRAETIRKAIDFLNRHIKMLETSDIYETPDCLGNGKKYLNQVIKIETDNCYDDLNRLLKKFEIECGRDPESRRLGDVPIDIDIVVWEGEVKRKTDYNATYFQKGYNTMRPIIMADAAENS